MILSTVDWPGLRVCGNDAPDKLKPVPLTVTPEIVKGAAPFDVNVIDWDAEPPTETDPNERDEGLILKPAKS